MPRKGGRGLNFHDARGTLTRAYPYSELREDALLAARRFVALGIKPGDRIALVAETGAEFAAAFFGVVYAGAWPVPLPLPTSFGGREAYVEQLAVQLKSCDPALFLYPPELADFCSGAADKAGVSSRDWDTLGAVEPASGELPHAQPDDIAYLQYSSGSTRFPHGVAVTHHALARQPPRPRHRAAGRARPTAASPGCPGTTTWAWSAASCRRCRCSCRSII